MTKKNALELAISILSTDNANDEAVGTLTRMVEQLDKAKARTPLSEEQKAAINFRRKAATAEARAKLVAVVAPIVRKVATTPMTAKEIFAASDEWPSNFTVNKLQNVLIREMASELDKVEAKGKPNTYQIIG